MFPSGVGSASGGWVLLSESSQPAILRHVVEGDWADLADVPSAQSTWTHSGLVATANGDLVGVHTGQLVTLDPSGRVVSVVDTGLTEGHGLTLASEAGEEMLWVCDPGFRFARSDGDGDEGLATMFGKGLRNEQASAREW